MGDASPHQPFSTTLWINKIFPYFRTSSLQSALVTLSTHNGNCVQWRSKGILRPGANKNFAPPVLYNSVIVCTSRFVLSSYIGRLSFCIATTLKIFFYKFSRFIQKRFELGSPFSTLSSTLFFWHNLPTS